MLWLHLRLDNEERRKEERGYRPLKTKPGRYLPTVQSSHLQLVLGFKSVFIVADGTQLKMTKLVIRQLSTGVAVIVSRSLRNPRQMAETKILGGLQVQVPVVSTPRLHLLKNLPM